MSGNAGVWVDHRKAVVVELDAGGEKTSVVLSHVEKHLERGGDSPMKGRSEALSVPPDDMRQRALTGELNVYYDAVVAVLRPHDRLLLMGPGEAKGELHQRLLKAKLGDRVVSVQTEDKMTDPQIVAKVRAFFGEAPPRVNA